MFTHHVDFPFIHHDPDTQQKGKHELVFLKETAAHIAVETECEVIVYVHYPLLQGV